MLFENYKRILEIEKERYFMEELRVIELMSYHHAARWSKDFYYYEPSCSFYRLYYYYDGVAGYVKNFEKKIKFKKGHLYLLPAYDSYELSKEFDENFGARSFRPPWCRWPPW